MKISVLLQLLSVVIGLSQNRDVFQREVDSINKMPLRIAYLIPIDSLGRCVNEEFLDSENMYHYALVGEINSDMNILSTIYFDNQNNIRKIIESWPDGGYLKKIIYYNDKEKPIYIIFCKDAEFYGKIYYDGYNYYTEKSVPKCSYDKFKQVQMGYSISEIKNINNDFLQKHFYAPRINFKIKPGDKGFLCTSYIYTSVKGELTQIGADSIQISFGMPIVINSIEKKWCKISSVFNSFIGYIPIADIEIIKP
jgi:hypothetical protein